MEAVVLRRRSLRMEQKTSCERSLYLDLQIWRVLGREGGADKVGLRVGNLVVFSLEALVRRIRKRRGGRRRKGRRGMERRTGTTR